MRALLALLIAFLAGLPTAQAPRQAAQPAPAAATVHVVAALHTAAAPPDTVVRPARQALRLLARSTPAWPGAAGAGWAGTGPSGGSAAPPAAWFAPAGHRPVGPVDTHVLAIRGRAPPHDRASSVSCIPL